MSKPCPPTTVAAPRRLGALVPSSIDRRIAHKPRWLRLCLGALPGLLLALLTLGTLSLTGDPGKAMRGTLGEWLPDWLLLPVLGAISGILVNVASERYLAWERRPLAAPGLLLESRPRPTGGPLHRHGAARRRAQAGAAGRRAGAQPGRPG